MDPISYHPAWSAWQSHVSTFNDSTEKLSEEQLQKCQVYYLVIRVCFGGSLVVLGVIGNVLTIIVMRGFEEQSATIRALLFLAVADLFVLLEYGLMTVSIPVLSVLQMSLTAYNLQMYFMAYLMPCGQIANLISVFIMVAVTWQRYMSVCKPHLARACCTIQMVHKHTVIAVTCSVIFHLPLFFQYYITQDGDILRMELSPFARHKSYTVFYSIFLLQMIRYILPITVLSYMTAALILNLRKGKSKIMNAACRKAREELTLSLIIVVIIFIICQSFAPARQILTWIYSPYTSAVQCGGDLFYFGPLDLISLLINSSTNFLIFIVCAKGFRRRLKTLLTKKADDELVCDHNNPQVYVPKADAPQRDQEM